MAMARRGFTCSDPGAGCRGECEALVLLLSCDVSLDLKESSRIVALSSSLDV